MNLIRNFFIINNFKYTPEPFVWCHKSLPVYCHNEKYYPTHQSYYQTQNNKLFHNRIKKQRIH